MIFSAQETDIIKNQLKYMQDKIDMIKNIVQKQRNGDILLKKIETLREMRESCAMLDAGTYGFACNSGGW